MTEPKKPNDLFDKAQAAYNREEWSTASGWLIQVLQIDARGYRNAYDLLVQVQDCQKAENQFQSGLKDFEEENWAAAIKSFEAAIRNNPNHRSARLVLDEAKRRAKIQQLFDQAKEHKQKSKWDQVVKALKNALQQVRESNSASENLARVETLKGIVEPRSDLALEIQKQLTEAENELELARLYERGKQYYGQRNWPLALKCFEKLEQKRSGATRLP